MILLYNPQSNAGRKCVLPMSLLALGALLEGEHDYIIVDGNIERDPLARLDALIREQRVRVLGMTVMPGPQLSQAVPLARELKARHPELSIVWGGYFPTQHYDACLRAPYVDYVVRGHGEVVFKALVDALARGDTPPPMPGLCTVEGSRLQVEGSGLQVEDPREGGEGSRLQVEDPREGGEGSRLQVEGSRLQVEGSRLQVEDPREGGEGSRLQVEDPREGVEGWSSADEPSTLRQAQGSTFNLPTFNLQPSNLQPSNLQPANLQPVTGIAPIPHPEQSPDFPYHRVEMPRYLRRTFMGQRTAAHHSSYGCPFLCNFCAVVNMVNGRWLAQSAARTAGIVRRLVETYGADAVEFFDNNFFVHEARTAEFAERIRDLGIGWWGEARIDTLLKYSDRTWRLMAESGLRMAFMGAESGSDETLQRMNKGGTASAGKTLEIAAKMKQYGIVPEFSFVLGNPPDPEADIRTTVEFIRRVKHVNPASEIIMYMYTPVPLAGELYEQARAEGFQFPETLEEWVSPEWSEFAQRRSAGMPWLKDPLRRSLHDFERVLNAYYPTATDPRLTRTRRWLLKTASAWRYHLRFYSYPLELRVLHKFLAYQRPETSGF